MGDILRGLLDILNWLSLALPFWLSASVAGYLRSKKASNWLVAPVAALVFLLPLALYYFAYPYVEFPYWMRWIHRYAT